MGDTVCFIITLLMVHENELIRCALKVKRDKLTSDCIDFPMEPENREQLWNLLPEHVRDSTVIVEVDEIFETTEAV